MREFNYTDEQGDSVNDKNSKSVSVKKSLKKRIIAWVLGVGIFAGAVAGGIAVKNKIEDNTTGNGAYLKAIKSRYEKVDATLTRRLNLDTYSSILNKKVQTIRFEEPEINDVELVIDYEGNDHIDNKEMGAKAIYKVLIDYYNKLVDAEESKNMLDYLDCLNEVFENMNFESKEFGFKMQPLKFEGCDEDASEKINGLLGLEKDYDGIVKQVAFLPYKIENIYWFLDETGKATFTYKLSGISYCETVNENNDQIESSDDLISDKTYNKNKIKAYYRDIEITTSFVGIEHAMGKDKQIQYELERFAKGEKTEENFEVKTTYFEETKKFNVFDEFLKMKNGNFDYEKPENVDMSKYSK